MKGRYNYFMKKQIKPANSAEEQANSSLIETPSPLESFPFPIVGIGASAGGLVITFANITMFKKLEAQ